MSFVTGLLIVDAPASALNNQGAIPGERNDNTSGVKFMKTKEGTYPYVSAQALRYWLRTTLEKRVPAWISAPVYREKKIAYTDANPLLWWDDDLLGYMRAPSTQESAKEKREADVSRVGETKTAETISRVSPFRVSSLISIAPVSITSDFGTMTRQEEGHPILHEHQFYRTTLKGLVSLDLASSGTFSYRSRSGYRNLDEERLRQAQEIEGIEHFEKEKLYRLPFAQRLERITALFQGMSLLEGGAKQSIHYTDVTPSLIILAVTIGGNNIFNHVIGANSKGLPELKLAALQETLQVNNDQLLSPVYIGWTRGYMDEERVKVEAYLQGRSEGEPTIHLMHPRLVYQQFIEQFQSPKYSVPWLQ